MSLPVTIPFTFGNATTTQSLSSLDTNFTTISNAVNGLTNGASQINVASISATGTANSTTYLRGDGAWATVSGGGGGSSSNISNGTSNVAIISSNGNVTAYTNGNLAMTIDSNLNTTFGGTAVMASSFLRNRIINGDMRIDQRNAGSAQTITAAAALAYTVDRWYAYCTGANVTGQQVQGATANQYRYQFTGATSVTAIGFAQRIEAVNSSYLAGTTATLSVDLSNSVLTTVTWTAYYANTTNTFGTLASPTVTSIATGTFTVTSTVTRYNAQISIPAAATTGLQILFTVGAQTSGTWVIGNVQLEPGSVATPFERRQYGQELVLCQRYAERVYATNLAKAVAGANAGGNLQSIYRSFAVTKRTSPTMSFLSGTAWQYYNGTAYADGTTTLGAVVDSWQASINSGSNTAVLLFEPSGRDLLASAEL